MKDSQAREAAGHDAGWLLIEILLQSACLVGCLIGCCSTRAACAPARFAKGVLQLPRMLLVKSFSMRTMPQDMMLTAVSTRIAATCLLVVLLWHQQLVLLRVMLEEVLW